MLWAQCIALAAGRHPKKMIKQEGTQDKVMSKTPKMIKLTPRPAVEQDVSDDQARFTFIKITTTTPEQPMNERRTECQKPAFSLQPDCSSPVPTIIFLPCSPLLLSHHHHHHHPLSHPHPRLLVRPHTCLLPLLSLFPQSCT